MDVAPSTVPVFWSAPWHCSTGFKEAVAVFSMAGGSPSAWESWNLHSGVAESSRNFSWNEAQQFGTKDSQVHGVAGGEGTTGLQYRVECRVCDSTKC